MRPTENQIDDLMKEIKKRAEQDERVLVITLTKRMAEDLAEYLSMNDVKVRYLHADIQGLKRTELIRQLRLGEFDVIVGINLLREGLDIPEVSLVAILDADKEGFSRNNTSLLQIFGRAARNVNGAVIMYANAVTKSMRAAIDETNRRRDRQLAYNKIHGIIPRSITKSIPDQTVSLDDADVKSKHQIAEEIIAMESKMAKYAMDLDFEHAIECRDKIRLMRKRFEQENAR